MSRRIVPIVEGHGEARTIPAFIRRVLQDMGVYDVEPDRAIREHRHRLVKRELFISRVRMAEHRPGCAAILVLFDADDDAACQLGPKLAQTVHDHGIGTPCHVILAVREIESWLIAGIESLRGFRGVSSDVTPPGDVETIRGAKEWLDRHMDNGYKTTIDQLPLMLRFDYQDARRRAPSLDKFLRVMESMFSMRS